MFWFGVFSISLYLISTDFICLCANQKTFLKVSVSGVRDLPIEQSVLFFLRVFWNLTQLILSLLFLSPNVQPQPASPCTSTESPGVTEVGWRCWLGDFLISLKNANQSKMRSRMGNESINWNLYSIMYRNISFEKPAMPRMAKTNEGLSHSFLIPLCMHDANKLTI